MQLGFRRGAGCVAVQFPLQTVLKDIQTPSSDVRQALKLGYSIEATFNHKLLHQLSMTQFVDKLLVGSYQDVAKFHPLAPVCIVPDAPYSSTRQVIEAFTPNISLFNTVALAGTFDHLHFGDMVLLSTAAMVTRNVLRIGIMTEHEVRGKAGRNSVEDASTGLELLQSMGERQAVVREFLKLYRWDLALHFAPISNTHGHANHLDIDALLTYPQGVKNASLINETRVNNKLAPVQVLVVPRVRAPTTSQDFPAGRLCCQSVRRFLFERASNENKLAHA